MVKNNSYEEARKQRLEENKKRFEDLGILGISKGLADLKSTEKKTQKHIPKHRSKSTDVMEPRRSSRARNPIPSYQDDVNIGRQSLRRRSNSSSWESYIARPLDEVKTASYEERVQAIRAAEELQTNLQSENPSFVKSMVRSHVYSCFWLAIPSKFCEEHLSKAEVNMVLEDEDGTEYEALFIGKRTGLSGGWRAFALDHRLDDGDALVFELIEPTRFKVYIVKASPLSSRKQNAVTVDKEATKQNADTVDKEATKKRTRDSQSNPTQKSKKTIANCSDDVSRSPQKLPPQNEGVGIENKSEKVGLEENKGSILRRSGRKR